MRSFNFGIMGAAIVGLALSSAARAADFPAYTKAPSAVQSIYDWSGFHVGVNFGGGMSDHGQDIVGNDAITKIVVASGAVPNHLKTDPRGLIGGGQIGYDHQFGAWVFGLEADFQGGTIKSSDSKKLDATPLGFPVSLTTSGETKLDWYGTIRGRVGFTPVDRLLLFVTGGGAYGHLSDRTSIVLAGPAPLNASAIGSYDATKFGYTIGAGMEYGITRNIILRAQYDYLDFGSHNTAFGTTVFATPVAFGASRKDDFHTIRLGANWKL